MRFGTYHTFQYPEPLDQGEVFHREMERLELADHLGYDDVWIPEQHFTRYCLSGDPLVLAGHAAARTRRVRIGLSVVNLCFAHPLRLAEQAAIVDVLSQGRLDLGIGRGYQPIQYPVFGVRMEETRQRFSEVLEILLRAWSTERFSFQGQFYQVPEVSILPKPHRGSRVSMLMASNSRESAAEAARLGLPALMARPFAPSASIKDDLAYYRQQLVAAGRSQNEIESLLDRTAVMKLAYAAPTDQEAREEPQAALQWHVDMLQRITIRADQPQVPAGYEHMRERFATRARFNYDEWLDDVLIFGSPRRCAGKVRELQALGVRRLILWHGAGGLEHAKTARSIELFAREVLPAFRPAA